MRKQMNILAAAAISAVACPLATMAHPGHDTMQYGATHALLSPDHLLFVVLGGLLVAAFAHRLPCHGRIVRAVGISFAAIATCGWLCLAG